MRKRWFSSRMEPNMPTQTATGKIDQLFRHASWPFINEQLQDCVDRDLKSMNRMPKIGIIRRTSQDLLLEIPPDPTA